MGEDGIAKLKVDVGASEMDWEYVKCQLYGRIFDIPTECNFVNILKICDRLVSFYFIPKK